jgi:hypothetical protein
MVLDFSEDRSNPNFLSKNRLDLARKVLTEKFPQFANLNDGKVEKLYGLENIVLFDMILEDLESNVANGCLLCDWLLQEHSRLKYHWEPKLVLAADFIGDNLHFGTLELTPGIPKFNRKGANEKEELNVHVRSFSDVDFQILTLSGMFHQIPQSSEIM